MFPDYNSYNQYYGLNDQFGGMFGGMGGGAAFDYRNMMPQSNSNEEIITLSQAIESIRKSIGDEREDELFYDSLIAMAPTENEKNIITSIRDDERKHNKILRELYFSFTGQMFPSEQIMTQNNNTNNNNNNDCNENNSKSTYKEMLEKALFGELNDVIKYRRILGTMPSGDSYTLIMAIMTDELRHSAQYNYLIHMAG